MERKPGQRETSVHDEPRSPPFQQAKEEANISDTQSKRWQQLAAAPREDVLSWRG
jgi:hypothetical protein